jgi:hypothetical protein
MLTMFCKRHGVRKAMMTGQRYRQKRPKVVRPMMVKPTTPRPQPQHQRQSAAATAAVGFNHEGVIANGDDDDSNNGEELKQQDKKEDADGWNAIGSLVVAAVDEERLDHADESNNDDVQLMLRRCRFENLTSSSAMAVDGAPGDHYYPVHMVALFRSPEEDLTKDDSCKLHKGYLGARFHMNYGTPADAKSQPIRNVIIAAASPALAQELLEYARSKSDSTSASTYRATYRATMETHPLCVAKYMSDLTRTPLVVLIKPMSMLSTREVVWAVNMQFNDPTLRPPMFGFNGTTKNIIS